MWVCVCFELAWLLPGSRAFFFLWRHIVVIVQSDTGAIGVGDIDPSPLSSSILWALCWMSPVSSGILAASPGRVLR